MILCIIGIQKSRTNAIYETLEIVIFLQGGGTLSSFLQEKLEIVTWQILFSTINKNTKKSNIISHLTVNGLDIEDQLSMACHFNKFFSEIATKTVSNINISNKDPTGLIAQSLNSFRFSDKNLTKEEVLEATKLLLDKKNT